MPTYLHRRAAGAAAGFAALMLCTPATAAVSTSGCASNTECTLTELLDGGSIGFSDVLFDGFADFESVGDVSVDSDDILFNVFALGNQVMLLTTFSPPIVLNDLDVIEFDYGFDVGVEAPSARQLESMAIETSATINEDLDFGFYESSVEFDIPGNPFALASDQWDGFDQLFESESEPVDLGGIVAAAAMVNVQSEAEGAAGDVSLTSFGYVFTLSGEPPVIDAVPLPAALPMMAAALGGLGLMGRRKRDAKA